MYADRFTPTTLRMFSSVIVWAVHFTVIYGFTALACARHFADVRWLGLSVVTWVIAAATLAAIAAVLVALVPAGRNALRSFESGMTAGLAAFALIAIVWEALPVLMVPLCD